MLTPHVNRILLTSSILVIVFTLFFLATTKHPTDRDDTVFVYGTLKYSVIRNLACWCRTEGQPATLTDYRKERLNIVPVKNETVAGKIIRVNEKELSRLDRYEDVPTKYHRQQITIDGKKHWVYILNER